MGAALADVPRRLNHESHRIAVTGLRRAGKTVFVTSFAHALLNASKAPKTVFPFFPWRDRIQDIGLRDIPGISPFPYQARLADLLAPSSKWPKPTNGLTGLRIRIHYDPLGVMARTLSSSATLDLDLVDYPGEWLLDLPLLKQSFGQWSSHMEEIANSGSRPEYAKPWLDKAKALDPDAKADFAKIGEIGSAYRDYLVACRDKLNLYYLQPGRFLVDGTGAPGTEPDFFPMTGIKTVKSGSNAAELIKRYKAYQVLVRRFYNGVFGHLRKQIILVDLLTALQQGHESFADLALATRTISEAFDDLKSPLLKVLPRTPVDRLALVATKADHVTADQLNNLIGLLRDMIGDPFFMITAKKSGTLAVASVRSTTQVTRKYMGEDLNFLSGVLEGGSGAIVEIRPGVIPGEIPDAETLESFEFKIRNFMPPKLSSPYEKPLPHTNLDKVLQFLIA